MIPVAITNNISALRCRLLIQLIEHCGGMPILIPILLPSGTNKFTREQRLREHLERVHDMLSICKAVLIPGNKLDVPPAFYGESFIHPETAKRSARRNNNVRFETECFMAQYALDHKLPFIGICGGLQVFNVVLGGRLVQHLPDDMRVRNGNLVHLDKTTRFIPRKKRVDWEQAFIQHIETGNPPSIFPGTHALSVIPDSLLGKCYLKSNVDLNNIYELSVHHQGCFDEQLAPALRAVAYAPDGVVEAAELKDTNQMGLITQFHWECNVGGVAKTLMQQLLAASV